MRLCSRNIFAIFILVVLPNSLQAQTSEGYTWQEVHSVDFGEGANYFNILAASEGYGGELQLRIDSANGPVIGHCFFHHTGGPEYFLDYECDLNQTFSGLHDVHMNFLDYTEPDSGGVLIAGEYKFELLEDAAVTSGDRLHVYPPVPGLAPSPYYEMYVQKVSDLNSSNLAEVTNWETPFSWFTQCPDYAGGETDGYYSRFIGGWSHTYTNFELDPNTPVVVKIVRKGDTGDDAPAGPINTAAVHPAERVDSYEIINGDVYVTLSQPTLVAIDIDGQMDTRVSPRFKPTGWGDDVFPYNNKKDGAHSVSIFANPFIEDKPNPDDPGVLVVKAGEKIPDNLDELSWDILYFEPGIHRASVDVDSLGNLTERRWESADPITLEDNKSYYIPGDAIVYANFTDYNRTNNQSVNIRVFGHGTISGSKIDHHLVLSREYPEVETGDGWLTRAIHLHNAENCHYEGITVTDPAFHTLAIVSTVKNSYPPNTVNWAKIVAWRTNSDASALGGNVHMEDCFFRAQDDGHYTGGTTLMRRVVFWHDVNGQMFRNNFATRRYSEDNAPDIPRNIIIEDIDIIYARGVFSLEDSRAFAVIGGRDGHNSTTLEGGVINTGQMIYFRNIRVSDPKPTRFLFGFDSNEKIGDYAGWRFENITYSGKQVFGWPDRFYGSPTSDIRNLVFDNVSINGKKVDQEYMNNPQYFETDRIYDFTFRLRDSIPSTSFQLTRTATNGSIELDTVSGSPREVTVSAVPNAGYRFESWSGDLTGTDNPVTITMDGNKAITANFGILTYSINTSAVNGTIMLDPAADFYLPGAEVKVTATGNLGYGFESWGGDLSGSENPITIVMDGDKSLHANFVEVPTYTLDIITEYGSVVLDPPGGEYNPGAIVTIFPEESPGYYFEQWLGDIEGYDNPATITMDTNKTVTARFAYAGWGSTTNAINFGGTDYIANDGTPFSGDDSGATYSTGAGISGTEDDPLYKTERFGNNFSINIPVINGSYQVTLMFAEIFQDATGERSFNVSIEGVEVISNLDIFSKVGKNAAYNETHEVMITDEEMNIAFTSIVNNAKISAIKVVSNLFEGETYTLTTGAPENGTLTIDPADGSYPAGSNVFITAMPDPGHKFNGWSGDLEGTENPATLYMNGDKIVSASFIETNWYTLTTSTTNGTISIEPGEGIYGYTEGTEVTLTASPDEGYSFTGWGGDLEGIDTTSTTLLMDGDKNVIAHFEKIQSYTLAFSLANGSVEFIPGGGTYDEGTVVTVQAIPDNGFVFNGWSGDLSGMENPTTIVMDSDKEITAEFFNPNVLTLTINSVNGTVEVIPEKDVYSLGASVVLVATPDQDYEFMRWEGDLTGSDNPAGIVMDNNKNITAVFNEVTSTNVLIADHLPQTILMQNYPNPFSTETTIQYELNKTAAVKLTIYNLLGHQVAVLVDEHQVAGSHSVTWHAKDHNGEHLANGLYIYHLETGDNVIYMKKASFIK